MVCDIIKPAGSPTVDVVTGEVTGDWEYRQNKDSGDIEKVWVQDNPTTTLINEEFVGGIVNDVPCIAKGISTSGIQGAATTEKFSEIYENVDWIKLKLPKTTNITKRDQITNIRSKKSRVVIWEKKK